MTTISHLDLEHVSGGFVLDTVAANYEHRRCMKQAGRDVGPLTEWAHPGMRERHELVMCGRAPRTR